MTIDGDILKLGVELAGMALAVTTTIAVLKSDVRSLSRRMSRVEDKVDTMNKISETQARFDERVNNVIALYNRLATQVDELAHGHGFISK